MDAYVASSATYGYFMSSRAAASGWNVIKKYTSGISFTNGTVVCQMTDDQGDQIYFAMRNGVCYFDVEVEFDPEAVNPNFGVNGLKFNLILGGVKYGYTVGSSYLTAEANPHTFGE